MKVNFVIPKKYRKKAWPELLAGTPHPRYVLDAPHRIVSGVDAWILQTWALLCTSNVPITVELVEYGIPGEISVFHYDHATPANGIHEAFAMVIRADRPPVPLADIVIEQNPCVQLTDTSFFLPSWPQPGLIPRDPSRRAKCTQLAYVGSQEYVPNYMKTDTFKQKLRAIGVEFCRMHSGEWVDYSQVDILVAVRDVPQSVLNRKPYAKLVNAWLAGIPIILGKEPAYQSLRQSNLDFFEAQNEEEVLAAVTSLVQNAKLYQAMQNNAHKRAHEFSISKIVQSWCDVLEIAAHQTRSFSIFEKYSRYGLFLYGKCSAQVWKRMHGWNE
ncbi:glycosyltransferase [Desulfoplanes formicivorans]|uniref:Glycosyltransferase n=1 Tax=Desulfoplanes formicivorans TaxID=1592317 RepID=A0A194AMZ0_9BACT|nr:hypothetical protein [Desulfoplanes formicivorans]GAU09979.1 hypothetical protein DPF_2715 [Desulfoplanes formicivorans]